MSKWARLPATGKLVRTIEKNYPHRSECKHGDMGIVIHSDGFINIWCFPEKVKESYEYSFEYIYGYLHTVFEITVIGRRGIVTATLFMKDIDVGAFYFDARSE